MDRDEIERNTGEPLKISKWGDRCLLMCPCAPPNDRNDHGTDDDDEDQLLKVEITMIDIINKF